MDHELESSRVSDKADKATEFRDNDDVEVIKLEGREFILVGTAHISQDSVDLVRNIIEAEAPDCVCIELDAQRYKALSEQKSFEALRHSSVFRGRF